MSGAASYFTSDLFAFFRALKRHNNRDWFLANKARFEASVRDPFLTFITDFGPHLARISPRFVADPRPPAARCFGFIATSASRPTSHRYRRTRPPISSTAPARPPVMRPVSISISRQENVSSAAGSGTRTRQCS